MSRLLFVSFAAACLAATSSNGVFAQNKTKPATDDQYKLLSTYPEMVGTIQGTAPGMVTLRVQFDHPKAGANPVGGPTSQQLQRMQQLQGQMAATAGIANPAQRQQKMASLQNQMAQLQAQMQGAQAKAPAMVRDYIDYDLPLIDKAVIRRAKPSVEYDEKGDIKKSPEKEKGQVGFPGKFEDLSKGDEVKVYFAKAGTVPQKGAAGDFPANRPRVRMVMITNDVDGSPASKKKK